MFCFQYCPSLVDPSVIKCRKRYRQTQNIQAFAKGEIPENKKKDFLP